MTEKITIREARPADYDQLHALIKRVFTETGAQNAPYFTPEMWYWQYLTPGFEALVVVADDGGTIVGGYHLVSRDMTVFGQPRKMVTLQDLCVAQGYRRRGLFTRMSHFAMNQASARGWDVTFSYPNQRSFPGFIKSQGYRHIATMPTRIRPLNPGAMLAARLPPGGLWRALGRAGVAPYDVPFWLRGPGQGAEVAPIERFTPEVDELSRQFLARTGIGCVRDARLLNWRFLDKPTGEYTAWELRRAGELRAYLVTRPARMFGVDCALLMDFGCRDGADTDLRALITGRLRAARAERMALAVAMGLHPFMGRFRRLGFITVPNRVNPRPLRLIVQGHTDRVGDEIYAAENWFSTLADWDVL